MLNSTNKNKSIIGKLWREPLYLKQMYLYRTLKIHHTFIYKSFVSDTWNNTSSVPFEIKARTPRCGELQVFFILLHFSKVLESLTWVLQRPRIFYTYFYACVFPWGQTIWCTISPELPWLITVFQINSYTSRFPVYLFEVNVT